MQREIMEAEINKRRAKFLADQEFAKWQRNKTELEIVDEFARLQEWRHKIWFVDPHVSLLQTQPEFKLSTNLLTNRYYRNAAAIAFEYNNSVPNYNASSILINGLRFVAFEAPSHKSISAFQAMLKNLGVTHVVRLTPQFENEVETCFPYWHDNLLREAKINYVFTDNWYDNMGGDAQELLTLIENTRKVQHSEQLIGVHCYAGVARSGTFITGYVLLNEIDQQLAAGRNVAELEISIEKIIKDLSLQRFYMVGQPTQYVTLHKLVALYLDKSKR